MTSPYNISPTVSPFPDAASHFGEKIGSSTRGDETGIFLEVQAPTTKLKDFEPASVPLPAPDEEEEAALSTQSSSKDISTRSNDKTTHFPAARKTNTQML